MIKKFQSNNRIYVHTNLHKKKRYYNFIYPSKPKLQIMKKMEVNESVHHRLEPANKSMAEYFRTLTVFRLLLFSFRILQKKLSIIFACSFANVTPILNSCLQNFINNSKIVRYSFNANSSLLYHSKCFSSKPKNQSSLNKIKFNRNLFFKKTSIRTNSQLFQVVHKNTLYTSRHKFSNEIEVLIIRQLPWISLQ